MSRPNGLPLYDSAVNAGHLESSTPASEEDAAAVAIAQAFAHISGKGVSRACYIKINDKPNRRERRAEERAYMRVLRSKNRRAGVGATPVELRLAAQKLILERQLQQTQGELVPQEAEKDVSPNTDT